MAKSNAQKKRAHAVRNGQLDPQISRGLVPEMSTHERKLPTKQQRLDRQSKKYKMCINQLTGGERCY